MPLGDCLYGIPSIRVDGNDFLALYSVTAWARERASAGLGPTHIEVLTYRAGAHIVAMIHLGIGRPIFTHSFGLEEHPIYRLRDHLKEIGEWSDEEHQKLSERIDSEVMAQLTKKPSNLEIWLMAVPII